MDWSVWLWSVWPWSVCPCSALSVAFDEQRTTFNGFQKILIILPK